MSPTSTRLVVALLAVLMPVTLSGQRATQAPAPAGSRDATQKAVAAFTLSVDSIMRGPKLVGYPPSGLRWSGDSKRLYFEWRRPGDDEPGTWVVPREGGEPTKLSDEERRAAPPPNGAWDRDQRRILAVQDGDIVVIDTVAGTRLAVTRTAGNESAPHWTADEAHVTFVRDGNVFRAPVGGTAEGALTQLAEIGPKKPEPEPTGSQRFVKEEERKLIEAVKEAAERREREEERKKRHALPKFDLAERQSVIDAVLAPGEQYLYMLVSERTTQAKTVQVPSYVTESAYAEDIATRTKVGDSQEGRRVAILDLKTGKSVWAVLPGAPAETPHAAGEDGAQGPAGAGEPSQARGRPRQDEPPSRQVRWSLPLVSREGHAVAVARSGDNKDRWLVTIDPATGTTRPVEHLNDAAWVRDLGGFGAGTSGYGWLDSGRDLWFTSERDGWMHLYVADVTTSAPPRQLTSGPWEITDVELSRDRATFFLTTTEVDPGERQVFAMPVGGGERTRLTSPRGAHSSQTSPDGTMLALISSSANRPPEVYLARNDPKAAPARVTESTSEEWRSFRWLEPQVVRFKARDGVAVPARLFTPEMLGRTRDQRRPAVVFIHGAGYAQNAHHYWSSYYREYMFHHLLASRGYVVLDVDYRASSGYGRDWRTAVYRHMGGKDLDDIVDGAKFLVDTQGVHPQRIGVYGGSYGGFLTLMAMFTSPRTFAAGAALRPVTDWAHYNHTYTSNILNAPPDDAEAYRQSSPIFFAEGLEGALLICHGVVDTNVHFQDSVRLAQRLIELRKENWELALFPVENHGFERETSWADEYKRILKLFETRLRAQ